MVEGMRQISLLVLFRHGDHLREIQIGTQTQSVFSHEMALWVLLEPKCIMLRLYLEWPIYKFEAWLQVVELLPDDTCRPLGETFGNPCSPVSQWNGWKSKMYCFSQNIASKQIIPYLDILLQ